MRFLKSTLLFGLLLSANVFSAKKCEKKECRVLHGTNTIVISISIDGNGYPQPSLLETMSLHPGEKIVFSGPEEFTIFFKEGKSPSKKFEFNSKDGVVVLRIPEHLFEDNRFSEEIYRNEGIIFSYGIRANSKVTDPSIRIVPS